MSFRPLTRPYLHDGSAVASRETHAFMQKWIPRDQRTARQTSAPPRASEAINRDCCMIHRALALAGFMKVACELMLASACASQLPQKRATANVAGRPPADI